MASVSDKIEFLDTIKTEKDYFRVAKRVRNLAFDMASGRTYQYVNLRKVIAKRMKEEGIGMTEMARAIGTNRYGLSHYLYGRRPLPYKYIERILGILYMDNDFVERMKKD